MNYIHERRCKKWLNVHGEEAKSLTESNWKISAAETGTCQYKIHRKELSCNYIVARGRLDVDRTEHKEYSSFHDCPAWSQCNKS